MWTVAPMTSTSRYRMSVENRCLELAHLLISNCDRDIEGITQTAEPMFIRVVLAFSAIGLAALSWHASAQVPAATPQAANEARQIHALRTSEPIKIDGRLVEPAWSKAIAANNFLQQAFCHSQESYLEVPQYKNWRPDYTPALLTG